MLEVNSQPISTANSAAINPVLPSTHFAGQQWEVRIDENQLSTSFAGNCVTATLTRLSDTKSQSILKYHGRINRINGFPDGYGILESESSLKRTVIARGNFSTDGDGTLTYTYKKNNTNVSICSTDFAAETLFLPGSRTTVNIYRISHTSSNENIRITGNFSGELKSPITMADEITITMGGKQVAQLKNCLLKNLKLLDRGYEIILSQKEMVASSQFLADSIIINWKGFKGYPTKKMLAIVLAANRRPAGTEDPYRYDLVACGKNILASTAKLTYLDVVIMLASAGDPCAYYCLTTNWDKYMITYKDFPIELSHYVFLQYSLQLTPENTNVLIPLIRHRLTSLLNKISNAPLLKKALDTLITDVFIKSGTAKPYRDSKHTHNCPTTDAVTTLEFEDEALVFFYDDHGITRLGSLETLLSYMTGSFDNPYSTSTKIVCSHIVQALGAIAITDISIVPKELVVSKDAFAECQLVAVIIGTIIFASVGLGYLLQCGMGIVVGAILTVGNFTTSKDNELLSFTIKSCIEEPSSIVTSLVRIVLPEDQTYRRILFIVTALASASIILGCMLRTKLRDRN